MMDDRYQSQPWYVKLYRLVRHVPPGYLRAAWFLARWVLRGMPLTCPTYWAEAKLIWMLGTALIDLRLNHLHTHEEVMAGIRKTEYERRPWYVRAYRWWRHMPPAATKALLTLAAWLLQGSPHRFPQLLEDDRLKWTRWKEAKLIWTEFISIAHYRMGNCKSLFEYIEERRR